MADNQIILLPKDNYVQWMLAAQSFALKFGVNFTNDADSAGKFYNPNQVVTVVTPDEASPEAGVNIQSWFAKHYAGVKLDVVKAASPEALKPIFETRVNTDKRYGDSAPAAPSVGGPQTKRGLLGSITLRDNKPTYATEIENVFYIESIKNVTNEPIKFKYCGVKAEKLTGDKWEHFNTSWSGDFTILPGETGPDGGGHGAWPNSTKFEKSGTYRLTLAVCLLPNEDWVEFNSVEVKLVNWRPGDPDYALWGETKQNLVANGIRGDYLLIKKTNGAPNEDIWFEFSATNTNPNAVKIGGLGPVWSSGSQASWGDFEMSGTSKPNENVLEWADHLNIPQPGTYQVRLGVCFLPTRDDAEKNLGEWKALTEPITVTIK